MICIYLGPLKQIPAPHPRWPSSQVVGAATQILGIMEERARMKASRDGEGAKIVGNRTLPKEVP